MATSSFVEKIRVNNPKVMMDYVAALEAAEKAPVTPISEPIAREVNDSEELSRLMTMGIEKWGKK